MAERILITGAAGTLGRATIPALVEAGYDVLAGDIRPIDAGPRGVTAIQLDVRDGVAVRDAMRGVVGVLHAAAWHGIHLRDHEPDQFWDLNATGTYHVLQAALDAGTRAVVLSSTMGVYGRSREATPGGPAVRIHEALPLRPTDVYGATKVVAEQLSEYFARRGVAGVALRYGMFVPEPFHHAGIRFLYGGVDERDVAEANLLALRRLLAGPPDAHLGGLNIESSLPWGDDDLPMVGQPALTTIEQHWPDGPALLAAAGVEPWGPINEVYDIRRADEILGWRPRRGFAEYLDDLRAGRGA